MSTETLTLNHLGRAHEVFHNRVIFLTTGCALIRIGDAFRNRFLTILMCLTFKWLLIYI